MPFIKIKVNIPISDDSENIIKTKLGKAIELVPGKSEEYLLLDFEDNCHLYLRGDNKEPIAYIEASIWGNEAHRGYDAFSEEVANIFYDELAINPENIYINYSDIPDWAVGGRNIDRNRYR